MALYVGQYLESLLTKAREDNADKNQNSQPEDLDISLYQIKCIVILFQSSANFLTKSLYKRTQATTSIEKTI